MSAFRNRALDAGPYSFVWMDALTQKVREGGRTINVHVLVATEANADGHREILGLEVTSAEDGADHADADWYTTPLDVTPRRRPHQGRSGSGITAGATYAVRSDQG